MLKKIKRRLVFILTSATSLILIASMIIVYQLNISQLEKQIMENFLLTADSIINQIQSTNTIRLTDLSVIETQKHMIIYIEDNHEAISLKSSYQSKTDRETLLNTLQDQAFLEGIHIHSTKVPNSITRSSVIKVNGSHKDRYFGYVVLVPKADTYISLSLLCSINEALASTSTNVILYILVALLGILGLGMISFLLISHVLHPVQENERRQVEFVASASHELRSPLAYIQTATSELSSDCLPYLTAEPEQTLTTYIHNAQEECSRMSQLIEDMLLLASAEKKTWTLHESPVDIDNFLINSYDKLSYLCEEKQHELSIHLPDAILGTATFDHQRVYQVLQILVHNGVSYTPLDTIIELHVIKRKKHLTLQVIDHGPGIPDEKKVLVFERYYRGDSSRTEKNHFGLGLNIAKEIVSLLHGTLTLTDTPGGGCTFVIRVPIS